MVVGVKLDMIVVCGGIALDSMCCEKPIVVPSGESVVLGVVRVSICAVEMITSDMSIPSGLFSDCVIDIEFFPLMILNSIDGAKTLPEVVFVEAIGFIEGSVRGVSVRGVAVSSAIKLGELSGAAVGMTVITL